MRWTNRTRVVNDLEDKFNHDAAHQTYNVAVAKADGDRKVAPRGPANRKARDSQKVWQGPGGSRLQDGARRCPGHCAEAAVHEVKTSMICRMWQRAHSTLKSGRLRAVPRAARDTLTTGRSRAISASRSLRRDEDAVTFIS